ncbi:hypothetical protein vBPpSSYP_172 [Pseudomonas phage vB_PpS_SYP]|nr:hypothetical protein vBPpSSYP_172 [Pseudomonas phage vB_PpS_SYP]
MRLDTESVRALIRENETFKLEVQQAVINNIRADNIEEAVKARVDRVLKEMTTESGPWNNRKLTITDPKLSEAIAAIVKEQVGEVVKATVKNAVEAAVLLERKVIRRDMASAVREILNEHLTPTMAKEILLSKLI